MKKQINPAIKAHLIRGAFYLLLLTAVCAIPFALAQRNAPKRSGANAGKLNASQLLPYDARPGARVPRVPRVPNLSSWTIVANYPLVSESVSVSTDGTFAYGAGGFDGINFAPTNQFNRYDPIANTWTPLANVPGAFYDAPSVYAPNTNRIYVFGGIDATFTPSSVVQVYDVASGTWVANGANMPGARYFAGAAYYGGTDKIYVISGFDSTFIETSTTWEYDPLTDTWNTSRANVPIPLGGSGYSIVGQNIYLAGTWNGANGSTQHYRYDIVANTWTAVAPVPVNIYRPDSGAIGTNTYLVGGGNPFVSRGRVKGPKVLHPSTRSPAVSYNSTYIYDTLTDTWSTGPTTNVAHSFTGGTAIGNTLIVVTGFNGFGDTNTVEMATEGGGGTPTPTPTGTPGGCQFHVLIVYADTAAPTQLQTEVLAEPNVLTCDLFDAQAGTPTLAQLQQYQIVVPYSNFPFLDGDTLGNNLADYVDGGGIVVQYGFSHYGPGQPYGVNGRWVTGNYNPYNYSTNIAFGDFSLGTHNAGHPLMAGVTMLNSDFENLVSPAAGATEVAQDNFADSLVAFRPVSGGHTTVGVTAYVGSDATQSGDWGKVIVNAGNWLANCQGGSPTPTATASPTPSPTPTGTPGCTPVWLNERPMANARRNAAVAVSSIHLYAITGFNGAPDYTAVTEHFLGSSWVTEAPIPVPHAQSRGTAVGQFIYVPGGFN